MRPLLPAAGAGLLLAACASTSMNDSIGAFVSAPVTERPFGTTAGGDAATLFTLSSRSGMQVAVTDFGATLVSVRVPDRAGRMADVTLGFDDVSGYQSDANQYFGCTVGRVANRIAGARFELDGRAYELIANDGDNQLHGGPTGFHQRMWRRVDSEPGTVLFELVSEDGDGGYPGRVVARTSYGLTEDGALVIRMSATSDAPTPLAMTNHAYWNLAGHGAPTVLDHELELASDTYLAAGEGLIPTGEMVPATGPMDFTGGRALGADIEALVDTPAMGYDHCYVQSKGVHWRPEAITDLMENRWDARLVHPGSGRVLELYSNQPGLQVYSGNFLFGQGGKDGATYPLRSACCLEPQGLPNAVNEPAFPSVIHGPGLPHECFVLLRFRTDRS